MGVDFFRCVVETQKKHAAPGTVIANALQTNGILIDGEFARFLAEYNFLVGVSLDGPAAVHDYFRLDTSGRGSHGRVMDAIEAMRVSGVEFNILSLVNAVSVKQPETVYNYLVDQGFKYLQFIPCVEFDGAGNQRSFAIDGERWGDFLNTIFDIWSKRHVGEISIRLFDTILEKLAFGVGNNCQIARDCRGHLVVEHNGDVYPCDFFVDEELRLGNINDDSWEEILDSDPYLEFGARKRRWAAKCAKCPFLDFCAGDCVKHRLNTPSAPPSRISHLCEGWRAFYRHSLPKLRRIAKKLGGKTNRAPAAR